ncbi:uncharacterized protein V1518DRAFT_423139 [Limtongia smithiae]|uniref:uncharacterized protein n=1 Tax=Limtongia smithiae TaxID=1125753 RepID=UPI0034CF33D4
MIFTIIKVAMALDLSRRTLEETLEEKSAEWRAKGDFVIAVVGRHSCKGFNKKRLIWGTKNGVHFEAVLYACRSDRAMLVKIPSTRTQAWFAPNVDRVVKLQNDKEVGFMVNPTGKLGSKKFCLDKLASMRHWTYTLGTREIVPVTTHNVPVISVTSKLGTELTKREIAVQVGMILGKEAIHKAFDAYVDPDTIIDALLDLLG